MAKQIISHLISAFADPGEKLAAGDKMGVNQVVGRVAFVYEKIRNALDYKDEHLFRKNAIRRILKRKLLLEKVILENYLLETYHQENIAEHLLQELISARYLKNLQVPMKTIGEVDAIIQKYARLISEIKELTGKVNSKVFNYILETEAVEIESLLAPAPKDKALLRAMFSVMNARLTMGTSQIAEQEKELQVLLGCHRVLLKWDDSMLRTLLLKLYYPAWENGGPEVIKRVASNFESLQAEIEKQMDHPWRREITKILQRQAIIFWVIQDILEASSAKAAEIFSNSEVLTTEIKKACQRRYGGVRAKLRRGVVRSIIYVFFTKMVLALAIELPLDWYLSGALNYFTSFVNIIFPPLLMFFVAVTIRMPKAENTQRILEEIKQICLGEGKPKVYVLRKPRRRGPFTRFVFNLIYTLTFVFSIIIIFWALFGIGFNVVSSIIFILFLTLVSFFGIRIRRPVKEILAVEKSESALGSFIDFFSLPFVSLGRWLSVKYSKINVLLFLMDFIIEAPFKLLIKIFEDLFGFIKEKKEDALTE